jgi:hypothetical protein
LNELISGTRLVDLAIAITLLEAVMLGVYFWRTGKGVAPSEYLLNLSSGLALMLAVRSVLSGAAWVYLVACLATAGIAHGADVWRRWSH